MDAINSANHPHIFLSPTQQGSTAIYQTTGNEDAHVILRGGKEPNYDRDNVALCSAKLKDSHVSTGIVIDFSHANSRKQFVQQVAVGEDVAKQIKSGHNHIVGVMIESHLVEGRQDVVDGKAETYGQSITDACLGWEATKPLLERLAESVEKRFH